MIARDSSGVTDLHVETHGSGSPLVLLHGWGLNVRVWDSLVTALSDHHRIITIDLPGHGRSAWSEAARTLAGQAQIVARAIAAVGATNAALLGWSLGGQVALQIAASSADIQQLILVATTPKFRASEDWPHGMAPDVLDNFAHHLATDYRKTVSDFLDLQVRGSANSQETLAMLRAALFEHGEARPEALNAGIEILASVDLRSTLGAVHQPSLVIAGQYDRVTPPAAGSALADRLPSASYLEVRRAGHAPFLSHAEPFRQAVTDFLNAPPAARSTPPHPHAAIRS